MESTTQNNDINAINEVRKLFNEGKSILVREETKRIRKELDRKEVVYNFLKEKEQEGTLTNIEEKVLKKINGFLKN